MTPEEYFTVELSSLGDKTDRVKVVFPPSKILAQIWKLVGGINEDSFGLRAATLIDGDVFRLFEGMTIFFRISRAARMSRLKS